MSLEVLSSELKSAPPVEAMAARDEAMPMEEVMALGHQATEVYFHGTNQEIAIGDVLVPGANAADVSASRIEDSAWSYAESREQLYGGRGRVYEVVTTDGQPAEHIGPQPAEVNSQSFTVVNQIDVKPGRQGTLPDINWNEHLPYDYMNHPEDPPKSFHDDWKEPEHPSPNELPLPGFGNDYVAAERERLRVASGRPEM